MNPRWFAAAGILGLVTAQVAPVETRTLELPVTPSQTQDSYVAVEQGFEHLRLGNYDQAIAAFEEVLRQDYENFSAHFGLGLAFFRQERLGPAAFEFEQLTRFFPYRFEGWYNLGVMLALQGNYPEALGPLSNAVNIAEEATIAPEVLKQAYLTLATVERQVAPGSELPTLARAHERFPSDPTISTLVAQARVSAGRAADAIPILYQVLQQDPSNTVAARVLADIYVQQGMLDVAISQLEAAANAATDIAVRAQLVARQSELLRDVDPARAQALMQEAVASYPDLWQAQYQVGMDRLQSGDARGALEAFQVAEQIQPNQGEVLLGIAMAYEQLGEADEAYSYATRALQSLSGAQHTSALLVTGRTAYRTSNFTSAVEYLSEYTRSNTDNAEAWIWLGLAQFQNRNLNEAAEALERAQHLEPNNPQILLNLGAVQLAQQQYRLAEETLNRAVALDPENGEAWYNLGWALEGQERNPEAQNAWQRANALGYAPAASLVD